MSQLLNLSDIIESGVRTGSQLGQNLIDASARAKEEEKDRKFADRAKAQREKEQGINQGTPLLFPGMRKEIPIGGAPKLPGEDLDGHRSSEEAEAILTPSVVAGQSQYEYAKLTEEYSKEKERLAQDKAFILENEPDEAKQKIRLAPIEARENKLAAHELKIKEATSKLHKVESAGLYKVASATKADAPKLYDELRKFQVDSKKTALAKFFSKEISEMDPEQREPWLQQMADDYVTKQGYPKAYSEAAVASRFGVLEDHDIMMKAEEARQRNERYLLEGRRADAAEKQAAAALSQATAAGKKADANTSAVQRLEMQAEIKNDQDIRKDATEQLAMLEARRAKLKNMVYMNDEEEVEYTQLTTPGSGLIAVEKARLDGVKTREQNRARRLQQLNATEGKPTKPTDDKPKDKPAPKRVVLK